MEKIKKVSNYTLMVLHTLITLLPFYTVGVWAFIKTLFIKNLIAKGIIFKAQSTPEGTINLSSVDWTVGTQLLGFIADCIIMIPMLLGLIFLKKIFTNYKNGEIFNVLNAKYYNYLGRILFFTGFIGITIHETLMILAVTLSNPPGHRYISITFGTPSLEIIFYGVIIMILSWVMKEACKIKDEQQLTI